MINLEPEQWLRHRFSTTLFLHWIFFLVVCDILPQDIGIEYTAKTSELSSQ